jgi:predicted PurR-regulated permease PerM
MNKKDFKKWLYWFSLILVSIVAFKTIDSVIAISGWISNLFDILSPFLSAILIAYMLYIPCRSIEDTYRKSNFKVLQKHVRGLSVTTVYLILFIVIFIIMNFILPPTIKSIGNLITKLPGYYQQAEEMFDNAQEGTILYNLGKTSMIQNLRSSNIEETIKKNITIDNIYNYINTMFGAAKSVFNLFITTVVSIYILLERNDIRNFGRTFCKAMFSEKTFKYIKKYFHNTNDVFSRFISSQILDATIVGIVMIIFLSIMKIEYAVLLGLMIGVLNLIPYFGAIFAIIFAVLITIFTDGLNVAIYVALGAIVLQQIDANIINPKILGDSLDLSRILIIMAVTIGGAYFGPIGMFLGVPIMSMIKIVAYDYIEAKQEQKDKELKLKEKSKEKAKEKKKEKVVKQEAK